MSGHSINRLNCNCLNPFPGLSYSSWSNSLIAGWGTITPGLISLPGVLQKAEVVPVSHNTCQLVMGRDRIQPGMICAGGEGTDTCQVGVRVGGWWVVKGQ